MQVRSPKPGHTGRPVSIRRKGVVVPIESQILILRHQKVILDTALAELYGVPVKRLNQQVNRNRERFPSDFMFQLTTRENKSLRLQFATSKKGRGGRRFLPYAFTEHGAIMAATVLNSDRAVKMSVFVVRAFVRLRDMLAANRQFAARIEELEGHLETHDSAIQEIIDAIKETDGSTLQAAPQDRIPTSSGKASVAVVRISGVRLHGAQEIASQPHHRPPRCAIACCARWASRPL